MLSGKLKVTLGMHMIKYGRELLGPGTLKSAYLKNKLINLADAGSDVIFWLDH